MQENTPVRVAVDVGTSGGKMEYGRFDGEEIRFETVHRFEGITTTHNGRLVWDIDHIVDEVLDGLATVEAKTGRIDSVGIDGTAIGFGFVADGKLLEEPYFYLEPSLYTMEEEILETVSRRQVFEHTGHPSLPNGYYFLYHDQPEVFEEADSIVPVPQVLTAELGGELACDETYAMTLYMFDARERDWAEELLETLGLPTNLLPTPSSPSLDLGSLDAELADDLSAEPDILMPPSHDTATAMAALPMLDDENTFLATGSWLIPGLEIDEPVVSDLAFDIGASNEFSINGKFRFLRNMPGFSLLEDCRSTWKDNGRPYEYDEIIAAARDVDPRGPLFDPYDDLFFDGQREGDVIEKIEIYCERTGQTPPDGVGEITRSILESLAVRSAVMIRDLADVADEEIERIHLGGGGARNELFCELVAVTANVPVKAGPVEATAMGNALSQMVATGDIESYAQARRLIDDHFEFDRYDPQNSSDWTAARERMRELMD